MSAQSSADLVRPAVATVEPLTGAAWPRSARTLSQCFEHTCDQMPGHAAVVVGATTLTYAELDRQANQVAHLLRERGVGEGSTVELLLERSVETYVALLGVLKSGAAYVPLDPSFPADRVAYIVEDSGLRNLLTTSSSREVTRGLRCSVLELDGLNRPRLTGVDVARGVALFGMMATHVFWTFTDDDTPGASTIIASGPSAATFALIAGVSLAFMSGGQDTVRGRGRTAVAAGLAVRAGLIGAIGLLLGYTESSLDVILPFYALMFLLAIPLLPLPPKALAVISASWCWAPSSRWRSPARGSISLPDPTQP